MFQSRAFGMLSAKNIGAQHEYTWRKKKALKMFLKYLLDLLNP